MDRRTVNVERFDAAFRAMLGNAEFKMSDACNCLQGSYLKFALGISSFHWPDEIDGKWESPPSHFNISDKCKSEWYIPFTHIESWPETIDITDARACIENVMRIVEKHHGPQPWKPLFPSKEHTTGPTLQEFIATLGLTPVQAAE